MTAAVPLRALFYSGAWDLGGARTQTTLALRSLDRRRFQPHLLVPAVADVDRTELPDDVVVHGYLPVTDANSTRRSSRWQRWRRFAQILEEQQIDVVCDRTYLATLDAAVACRLRRTPRVSMAVADPEVQFRLYARRPRWLWSTVSRWAYRSADRVLANSAGLQHHLCRYWRLPSDRVDVQPNACDFTRIDRALADIPPPDTWSPHLLPKRPVNLLTVGRVDADKGHLDLLHALARFRDLSRSGASITTGTEPASIAWRIVGSGPAVDLLREAAAQHGLADAVTFVGDLTNPFPEYRAADLFCLPSRSEGSPNVLIEALACGVPVLATDCPHGPREILQDGDCGRLVPVGDVPALAAALQDFTSNPHPWQSRTRAGQQSVRERYTINTVIPQLEAHLHQAATRSR